MKKTVTQKTAPEQAGIKKGQKKSPKKKKATRASNGQFLPGNKDGKQFQPGNKAAEKYTEDIVLPILQKMWKHLTHKFDYDTKDYSEVDDLNIVRANDIKLLGEICLMFGISKFQWSDWKEKFTPTDETPGSPVVIQLMDKIKWLLECRLNYSGSSMDTLILRTHYDGYKEETIIKADHTTKGKEIENPFTDFLSLLKQTSALPGIVETDMKIPEIKLPSKAKSK